MGKSFVVQIRPYISMRVSASTRTRRRPTGRAPGPVLETEARGMTGKIPLTMSNCTTSAAVA